MATGHNGHSKSCYWPSSFVYFPFCSCIFRLPSCRYNRDRWIGSDGLILGLTLIRLVGQLTAKCSSEPDTLFLHSCWDATSHLPGNQNKMMKPIRRIPCIFNSRLCKWRVANSEKNNPSLIQLKENLFIQPRPFGLDITNLAIISFLVMKQLSVRLKKTRARVEPSNLHERIGRIWPRLLGIQLALMRLDDCDTLG